MEIIVNTCGYPGCSAAEHCKAVLRALGINYPIVKSFRGSHHANVIVFDEDEEKFKNEILGNVYISGGRRFYFSNSYDMFGNKDYYYNVQYG